MRIVIVGAGEVGSSIASSLAGSHDVVVIDVDEEKVEELNYNVDALAIQGDGASLTVLQEAGIGDADMLIASTDDDETNIITCGTAKTISDPFTIARVKGTSYLETWHQAEGAFGVDFMVGTTALTAKSVVRVVGLPAARDVDTFAGGRVQMAEFAIPEGSPVAGQTIQEADRFESLTFAAVFRDDEVIIPTGTTRIEAEDEVVVIGSQESVRGFGSEVSPHAGDVDDILIVGGTEVAAEIATLFEEQGLKPRLVEHDHERARELAERLPKTTVLEHDATDSEFLEREHVGEVDTVIAALKRNERNLLVSLLTKRLGVDNAVAIVNETGYSQLFEAVGVDVAISPREATAEEITRFTRERRAENVALIENDRAEVIEIEADADSVLTGRQIQDSIKDLPEGIVIGAITRNGDFVIPRGDTVIEVGDSVVVFAEADNVSAVTSML